MISISAFSFGFIKGFVRLIEKSFIIGPIIRVQRYANTERRYDLIPIKIQRFSTQFDKFFGNHYGIFPVHQFRQYENKFIAPQTGQGILFSMRLKCGCRCTFSIPWESAFYQPISANRGKI